MSETETKKPSELKEVVILKGVNKILGKRHILHDITFSAYEGEVFGFLGPNGAGKTTTIKMIVGLLGIDAGEISVCGSNVEKDFEKALNNIGGIVENPEMYKQLTGMQNLRQYARMRDGVTQERIDEVVELVGLTNRIKERITKYSLGMRQRLGVAQAILHHPKVLILDEPTNGLDPAGIKQLRDILKKLAHEEGVCVIVSSHLMSEMELMCDRVGIITNGTMVGVYSVDEMLKASMGGTDDYVISVDDAEKAKKLILSECQSVEVTDEHTIDIVLEIDETNTHIAKINKLIVNGGVSLYTVSAKPKKRLEDVFIELTDNKEDGQIA